MKYLFFLFIGLIQISFLFAQGSKQIIPSTIQLPNGWTLTPAGKNLQLGDLPLNIALSPSKRLMAITNNGQSTQSIELFDVKEEKLIDSITVAKAWLGLAFTKDEKNIYASAGNDNVILHYSIENKKLYLKDSLILGTKWPNKISPTGLTIDDKNIRSMLLQKKIIVYTW